MLQHCWPVEVRTLDEVPWLDDQQIENQASGDQLKATETVTPRSATVSVAQKNSSEAADSQRSDPTSKLQLTQQIENQASVDQLKATETVTPRSATVSVAQKNSSEAADSQRSGLTSKLLLTQQALYMLLQERVWY